MRCSTRALTLQVRGQQREGVLGKGSPGVGKYKQEHQQQGHEAGGAGHSVWGSSSPRGCPLTHTLALREETEKWGKVSDSLHPSCRQDPPLVYPQKSLWSGIKNPLSGTASAPAGCHCHLRPFPLGLAQTGWYEACQHDPS